MPKKKKATKTKGDKKGADALQKYSYRAAKIGPGSRKAHQRREAEGTAYGTQMRQYPHPSDPSGTKEAFIPVLHLPWEKYKAQEAKKAKHKSRMKKIRSAVTKGLKKAGVTRGSSTQVTWSGDN